MKRLILLAAALATSAAVALAADEPVVVDGPTEQVIDGALKYLASQQIANGSWSSGGSKGGYPHAMTGYVLMAYLATGNLPDEGDYKKNVNAGTQFLLESVQPDGLLRGVGGNAYMYSHGITTIALGEIYGQTQNPAIRPKLDLLVKVILRSQAKEGGWRYQPKPSGADISVTVIQVAALRGAKNAGIEVPQGTIDEAIAYVRSCAEPKSGGFTYQPGKKDDGFARTAAALYSLQVCGQYADPLVEPASAYLFAHGTEKTYHTYGHNYAAPAQYLIGGDTWRRWYDLMNKKLMGAVTRQGDLCFWEPKYDTFKPGVGPTYVTAVYTTILAMPYHYLPLYQR